jgi:hypothetical protein
MRQGSTGPAPPVRRCLFLTGWRQGLYGGQVGAVSFVQLFSALQVTPHFHPLVPDGVFVPREDGVRFEPLPPPTQAGVERLLRVVRHRVLRLLERRGALPAQGPEDVQQAYQAHSLHRTGRARCCLLCGLCGLLQPLVALRDDGLQPRLRRSPQDQAGEEDSEEPHLPGQAEA